MTPNDFRVYFDESFDLGFGNVGSRKGYTDLRNIMRTLDNVFSLSC